MASARMRCGGRGIVQAGELDPVAAVRPQAGRVLVLDPGAGVGVDRVLSLVLLRQDPVKEMTQDQAVEAAGEIADAQRAVGVAGHSASPGAAGYQRRAWRSAQSTWAW